MRRPLFVVFAILALATAFTAGVLAQQPFFTSGGTWQQIGRARQLGYEEGVEKGMLLQLIEDTYSGNGCKSTGDECVLSRLIGATKINLAAVDVLSAISQLYAQPKNLPISWSSAVIIGRAMVSGVPVSENDLQIIRRFDASSPDVATLPIYQ